MSSLDNRTKLKRDLSFGSTSLYGSSSIRATKRWKSEDGNGYQRKVSFGHLNETVLFDKKDSSSNLSLGVSVSNSSMGSMAQRSSNNFRWGEEQSKSSTGNATWGAPPSPREARWQGFSSGQRSNIFFQSSAAANALRSISGHKNELVPRVNVFHAPQSQAEFPARCRFPSSSEYMQVDRAAKRSLSFLEPPRCPGRTESPINTPLQYNNSLDRPRFPTRCSSPTQDESMEADQSHIISPQGLLGRCESPVTILPQPIHSYETSSDDSSGASLFGMPPKRPVRCSSPTTVSPQSYMST